VLAEHDTGQTYADLVEGLDRYPAIYDELGLFSFPPVINGKRTEVTTGSRELFVELTGTDQWTIDRMCNIVCYALSARGATIEQVEVNYADGATAPSEYGAELVRPNFDTDEKSVSHDRIETLLGVDFEPEEIVDCFERAGLDASYTLDEDVTYEVEIPPYRVDVLHPRSGRRRGASVRVRQLGTALPRRGDGRRAPRALLAGGRTRSGRASSASASRTCSTST